MNKLELLSLEVYSNGYTVYKQLFKPGINVIAGDNSTGKSSILEFIAYALGYEEMSWRAYQKKCEYVILEVRINNNDFVLKREINDNRLNAIYFKDSKSNNFNVLPYKNSTNKKSFSYHIFELLGYPLGKTEESTSAITMFQLLRLIYADQNTSPKSLFNDQNEYDNKGIRKSVAEYLLGIDDLESHEWRQELLLLEKKYSHISSDIASISAFLKSNSFLNKTESDEKIRKCQVKINLLTESLSTINEPNKKSDVSTEALKNIDKLKQKKIEIENDIKDCELEISDSEQLIMMLEKSTDEIQEALSFYNVYSGLKFIYCPQCLCPIDESHTAIGCGLCRSDKKHANLFTDFYFERKKEVEFQIKESRNQIIKKKLRIEIERDKILDIRSKIRFETKKVEACAALTSEQSRLISSISMEIAENQATINMHDKIKSMYEKIIELESECIKLKSRRAELLEKIKISIERQEDYSNRIKNAIGSYIVKLIKVDGGFESSFNDAKEAYLLFEESKIIVDGATKFSASSDAILKLAARFSLFYASLFEDRMRIPKFAILDCMEDKGMQENRAHAIQNGMIEMLKNVDPNSYQIIIATSMPSDKIREGDYILNHYYKRGEHTLNFSEIPED
ncbi:MAG: hypothetical protein RL095_465 [Verrucomicrobiota bacterium]|jgi:ribosomal protein L28